MIGRSTKRCPPRAIESLEPRRLYAMAVAGPVLSDIGSYTFPAGKTVQIPLTTAYSGDDRVVYNIKATSRSIVASIHPVTNTFIRIDVAGYSDPMVFELFNDLTPITASRFTGLVNAGFYNGLTFHRVIKDFVIQGGDPLGTGAGGFDHPYDDEYNANALFTGSGQLASASGAMDSNGSQFFITEGPQRLLDFDHTIFGQLVRGEDTRLAISNVAINNETDYKPISTVTITRAQVITDTTDAVLQVKSLSPTANASIRVTATTVQGSSSKTLNVIPSTDTINDPPIMGPVPAVYYIAKNTSLRTQLTATDLEGDAVQWAGAKIATDGLANASISRSGGLLIITPKANFTGVIKLQIGVAAVQATSRGSIPYDDANRLAIYDTQVVTVAVGDPPIATTAAALDAIGGAAATNALVATFRSADSSKNASSFTASIDWGDGTVTGGTVYASSRAGVYSVLGTKMYGASTAGTLPLSVTVSDAGGATATATAAATVRHYAAIVNGVLTVYGTSGNDRIGIGRKGAYYAVTVNSQTTAIAIGDVASISVYALGGRDRISIGADVTASAYIDGGDGNDIIYGGGGSEVINAGAGNDFVACGNGSNRVAGGDGNDTLIGGAGRDRLFGGAGDDSVSGGPGRDILSGDSGNDTVLGGTSDDTLYGGDGDDILNGLGGSDAIFGGRGSDTAKIDPLDSYTDVEIKV